MVHPGYPPNPQGPQTQQPQGNGLAVAGMVLGIITLLLCWVPFLNWILALLAIVFGAVGIGRAAKVGRGKGMAITGIVCGAVGAILGVVILVLAVRGVKKFAHDIQGMEGKQELNRMGKMAKLYATENGTFPKGKADLTPATDCCKESLHLCDVNDADWSSEVWKDLDFKPMALSTPFRFSYESADGKTFTARAVSDLDCDGTPETIELRGELDASGTPTTGLVTP